MEKLTKKYIEITLQEERLWKVGESDTFKFGEWKLTLRREENIYKPFKYSLEGMKRNTNGTVSSWSRRYISMEKAFLHILNRFNENANIRDNYNSIEEFIKSDDTIEDIINL